MPGVRWLVVANPEGAIMVNGESAFIMMSNGGWAALMLVLFVSLGVWLLIRFAHIFAAVPERPAFFGSIYILIGVTLILVGLALMKYVLPLLASSHVPFLAALYFLLLFTGAVAVLSGLVLIIKWWGD